MADVSGCVIGGGRSDVRPLKRIALAEILLDVALPLDCGAPDCECVREPKRERWWCLFGCEPEEMADRIMERLR